MKNNNIIVIILIMFILISSAFFIYKKDNNKIPVNNVSKNYDNKEECETSGNKWQKVWMAQVYKCVIQYSDWGKECSSSSECEWNCIMKNPEWKAFCAKDNNIFGCKNTIENVKAWEGILCID